MNSVEHDARLKIAYAEHTIKEQRRILEDLEDPTVKVAVFLHDILCRRWCTEDVHFSLPLGAADDSSTSIGLTRIRIRQQYMRAAHKLVETWSDYEGPSAILQMMRALHTIIKQEERAR